MPPSHAYAPVHTRSDSEADDGSPLLPLPSSDSPSALEAGQPTNWSFVPSIRKSVLPRRALWACVAGAVTVAVVWGTGAGPAAAQGSLWGAAGGPPAVGVADGAWVTLDVAHLANNVSAIATTDHVPATPALDSPADSNCVSSASRHPLNIHPHSHPVCAPSPPSPRYLSFENHSGFHNQLSSLSNALLLARLLNRTLLLPPARAGLATPWKPDLLARALPLEEHCKARRVAGLDGGRACRRARSDEWTYVGWEWIMGEAFLERVEVVDRWNDSRAWVAASREEGGLGLRGDEVWTFPDEQRRSYQLYDSREMGDRKGKTWSTRIDIPDLLLPPYADKQLLQFGSLFSFGRLQTALPESRRLRAELSSEMILSEPGLEEITDQIKARLGTYVVSWAHAMTGEVPVLAADTACSSRACTCAAGTAPLPGRPSRPSRASSATSRMICLAWLRVRWTACWLRRGLATWGKGRSRTLHSWNGATGMTTSLTTTRRTTTRRTLRRL